MVATYKFGLLTIRWHNAPRKHLFLYPEGDRSGMGKPKIEKNIEKNYLRKYCPIVNFREIGITIFFLVKSTFACYESDV